MTPGVKASAVTDVGRKREHNEDRAAFDRDLGLFIVTDGAGGHRAGDVAASMAVDAIFAYFSETEADARDRPEIDQLGVSRTARRLSAAIRRANRAIAEASKQQQEKKGMGTTVVAARLSADGRLLHVAHVGDSRCYRLRGGYLDQLTEDHSLINDLIEERPEIDDSVIERLPRNVVTRALGMSDEVRVSLRTHVVAPGDRYLLCTDGLTGPVGTHAMAEVLGAGDDPEQIARGLVDAANAAGGPDNVAALVVLCDFSEVEEAGALHAPPSRPVLPRDASAPEILLLGIEEIETGEGRISSIPEQPEDDLAAVLRDIVAPVLGPPK